VKRVNLISKITKRLSSLCEKSLAQVYNEEVMLAFDAGLNLGILFQFKSLLGQPIAGKYMTAVKGYLGLSRFDKTDKQEAQCPETTER
jgi:hypothetical protein